MASRGTRLLGPMLLKGILLCACGATAARAAGPQGFVLVSGGNMVTVKDGALTKLDPATDQIIAQVSFSTTNVTIAADPPRRLVYAAASDGKLSVFKADTLERADIAVSGLGLIPIGSAVTPDGRTLLLTTRGSDGQRNADDRLDVVSLNTGSWPPTASLSYSVPTGTHPINVMVDHAGRYAVVTVRDDPAVLVLDLGTRQTVLRAAMSFGSEPEGLDMHPTQDVAYALTHGANTIEVLDLTQDPPQFVASVPIWSVFGNPQPSKGKFTPDGRRMFVSAQSINRVLLFDTSVATSPVQDKTVSLPVGLQPHGIVFLPDGRAYVANTNNGGANGSISVLQNVLATPSVSGGPILTSLVGPNIFLSFVVDASSPSVPAGLTAAAAGSSRIDLSWTASTDDMGLAGYKVYRDGVWVATPTTNSYTDANLSPSQTYAYEVAAYDAAGNVSALSAQASATTLAMASLPNEDSPFGLHNAALPRSEAAPPPYDQYSDVAALGAKWARELSFQGLTWDRIELSTGVYDWTETDYIFGQSYFNGFNALVNVGAVNSHLGQPLGHLPTNTAVYCNFLRNAVERYDGDGFNDAPGSPVVRYWEIGNELESSWFDRPADYAELLKLSYDCIKAADSQSQVAMAGMEGPPGYYNTYVRILDALATLYPGQRAFDFVSFHWSGQFYGDYTKQINNAGTTYYMRPFISDMNIKLTSTGYSGTPIWITECSYNDGDPTDLTDPPGNFIRSESDQAQQVIKRFVYSLASGVKKVFWSTLTEGNNYGGKGVDNYFDLVGLKNNYKNTDGLSHRKLSYYTYKKLVEKLEGSDWSDIQIVQEQDGGAYAYKFTKNGQPVWVAWNDGSAQAALTLSGLTSSALTVTDAVPRFGTGDQVTDYATAFSSKTVSVAGGAAEISLSSSTPVWIEAAIEKVVATVGPSAASIVALHASGGTVELSIPAGSFSESVQLTLQRLASCPGSSNGLLATGVCVEIVLDKLLQPAKAAALTIAYRDGDVAGLNEKKLILARYDETHRGWVPLESGVDASANRVTGKTSHFSTFQIMQAGPAEGLDGARVYPNPFRPAKGHAQVVIDGLPAGAGVSIFTLRGKLVWKATASDAGMAVWPGVNRDGREAASGVYFVYVESGGRRRILKAAVVR